eukprot:972400-Pyramimonas_sp.AAC.1
MPTNHILAQLDADQSHPCAARCRPITSLYRGGATSPQAAYLVLDISMLLQAFAYWEVGRARRVSVT